VIPGYGYLSEEAAFAARGGRAGMVFVGPGPGEMREMGLKHRAREVAVSAGVPVVPGTALLCSEGEAVDAARRLGFPVRFSYVLPCPKGLS
jgi:acetyl/propionyl-CoA carboxylase alpha subunit